MREGVDAVAGMLFAVVGVAALARPEGANRNRLASASLAIAWVLLARAFAPGIPERSEWVHRFVLTLGYGHLAGALVSVRLRRIRCDGRRGGPRLRRGALFLARLASLLLLFAMYRDALSAWPPLVWTLLAVSVWHTAENDWQLRAVYRGGRRLPRLSRRITSHGEILSRALLGMMLAERSLSASERRAVLPAGAPDGALLWLGAGAVLVAAGVACIGSEAGAFRRRCSAWIALAIGLAAIAPQRWPPFVDVFSALTLYHLISFLVLATDRLRVRRAPGERGRGRTVGLLLFVHALPASLAVADLWAPGALLSWLFSPAPYLFFSALHVAHTVFRREAWAVAPERPLHSGERSERSEGPRPRHDPGPGH